MDKELLITAVGNFIADKKEYYQNWVFDTPIVASNKHHKKLLKLHGIMHKLILHFVNNFEDYNQLMMLSNKVIEITRALQDVNYKVGTFRTDFVYDDKQQPKLIEITCRFALNTLFVSSIFDAISKGYHQQKYKDLSIINPYDNLLPYLAQLSKTGIIYVLKGEDKKNESHFFKGIFEDAGRTVVLLHYKDIKTHVNSISKEDWIVSELTIKEIESLEIDTIKKLSQLNLINDFRTALLIHDKQFFSVLVNQKFQEDCLSNEEIIFFKEFLIPTYNFDQRKDFWKQAKENKNNWILKHKALGKSKSIYAGIVTPQEEWDAIFKTDLNDYVLQKWVPQQKTKGTIKNKEYNDYVTGTLLFFDEYFFGLGLYRTSSYPVTNIGDDRKTVALILDENNQENIEKYPFMNYIDS
ncbi:hypothetical protein DUT90_09575 [Polaribacter sp. WD7]|uniref:hypothetical protein n=1 Tax=Polaribacter sp. WD7 TaxID=2269061 RepID=UPI000DF12F71|nr:hypothetical protein [Polaribacter sp. WD7]RCS26018.1 hypothetical protein DUT90_09575 [Polaribacter sp. WD7]